MPGNTFDFAIAVGNPNGAVVNAVVSGGALAAPIMFSVPANSTVTQALPWVTGLSNQSIVLSGCSIGCCDVSCCPTSTFTPPTSNLVAGGAYHLTTSLPVSAYQFNALQFNSTRLCSNPNGNGTNGTNSYTNDASLLLPTPALTGNYLVLSHQAWNQDGAFVAITATDPNPTTVMVTLTAAVTTGPGVPAAGGPGITQTYTLNHGDVLQLITQHTPGGLTFDTQDLTGTAIRANHAVSVIAGVDCSFMSNGGTCYACDHLEQQLFPQETWGHDAVVSQLIDRSPPGGSPPTLWTGEPFFVRIMSRDNANTITFTPAAVHAPVLLNAGQFVEFCTAQDFEVQSTSATPGAFLVEQYMVGQNVTGCGTCSPTGGATNNSLGDPASVLEVPTAQYRTNYNFVVPATYVNSFINVVAPVGETVTLDGAALTAVPTTIPGTTWNVYRQAVTSGSHVAATAGAAGFGLKVLGVAPFTSYAYPGGLNLATLP
jgi:hypothetical protein